MLCVWSIRFSLVKCFMIFFDGEGGGRKGDRRGGGGRERGEGDLGGCARGCI